MTFGCSTVDCRDLIVRTNCHHRLNDARHTIYKSPCLSAVDSVLSVGFIGEGRKHPPYVDIRKFQLDIFLYFYVVLKTQGLPFNCDDKTASRFDLIHLDLNITPQCMGQVAGP